MFKVNAGFFSFRAGKLQHRSGAADALELNDVGKMKIAERALEFLAVRTTPGREERLDQIDEIIVRSLAARHAIIRDSPVDEIEITVVSDGSTDERPRAAS